MKIDHGFLGGFPDFGVRAPVLPSVDLTSSASSLEASASAASVEVDASLGVGDEVISEGLAPPCDRRFCCLSFLPLALPLSVEGVEAPFALGEVVPSASDPLTLGGGVEDEGLLARCGGRGLSGAGVEDFDGTPDPALFWTGGRGEATVLGVALTVAVRR